MITYKHATGKRFPTTGVVGTYITNLTAMAIRDILSILNVLIVYV